MTRWIRLPLGALAALATLTASNDLIGQPAENIPVVRQRTVVFDGSGFVGMGEDKATLPLTIASGQHFTGNRSLAERGGRFVQIYHSNPSGTHAVFMRRSTNGSDWSEPVQVSDPGNGNEAYYGSIRFVGRGSSAINGLVATYITNDPVTRQDTLWGTFSTDGGATWAPPSVVGAHPDAVSMIPTMTGVGDTVYAVWTRTTSSDRWDETFINRSRDGGRTWDTMLVAFPGHHFSFHSHAAAGSNGKVWIATTDDQFAKTNIQLSRSTNGGGSFTQVGNLNTESGLGQPFNLTFFPALEHSSGNTLYAVWGDQREGQANIYFSRSDNSGTNWTPHLKISGDDSLSPAVNDAGASGAIRPSIILSQLGRLYVVWTDDREGPSTNEAERNRDVYIVQSLDDGETWSAPLRVNDAPQVLAQSSPAVAIRSRGVLDSVLVTWNDTRGTLTGVDDDRTMSGGATANREMIIASITESGAHLEIAPSLRGEELVITLHDVLGRTVATLFTGKTNGGALTIPLELGDRPLTSHFLRARCAGRVVTARIVR